MQKIRYDSILLLSKAVKRAVSVSAITKNDLGMLIDLFYDISNCLDSENGAPRRDQQYADRATCFAELLEEIL